MATQTAGAASTNDTGARAWMPTISAHDGKLAFEHGMQQEIGWERRTDQSGVSMQFYADRIDNPALEAMSHFATGNPVASAVLMDPMSGLIHAAGPQFSTKGISLSFDHQLPGGNHVRLGYANGGALVMSSAPQNASL